MKGLTSPRCPECGNEQFSPERSLAKSFWFLASIGIGCIVFSLWLALPQLAAPPARDALLFGLHVTVVGLSMLVAIDLWRIREFRARVMCAIIIAFCAPQSLIWIHVLNYLY